MSAIPGHHDQMTGPDATWQEWADYIATRARIVADQADAGCLDDARATLAVLLHAVTARAQVLDVSAETWTSEQVLAWLAEQGQPIQLRTWHPYVYRGEAPKPIGHLAGRPIWLADHIRAWHANRRGQGWRATTTDPRPN